MADYWLQLLSVIIGGLIVYIGQRAVNVANANAVNVKTFQELVEKVEKLSSQVNLFERKNTALWQYVYVFLEHFRETGEEIPDPPFELETEPKLMKIIEELRKKSKST